jgi:hypothetical protein
MWDIDRPVGWRACPPPAIKKQNARSREDFGRFVFKVTK